MSTTITTDLRQEANTTGAPSSAPSSTSAHPLRGQLERLEGSLDLLTGERVQVRPIRADDTARLQAFHTHLSSDSIVFRFFRYLPTLPDAEAARFTHVDYVDRMALVATDGQGEDERLLAVVRYDRISRDTAEVAFVVADHWQGHGIATALLHRLAAFARLQGITHLLAVTLATNAKMLEVLRHAGYPLSARYVSGEVEMTLDISVAASGEPVLDS